jgi:hypothetical protein
MNALVISKKKNKQKETYSTFNQDDCQGVYSTCIIPENQRIMKMKVAGITCTSTCTLYLVPQAKYL